MSKILFITFLAITISSYGQDSVYQIVDGKYDKLVPYIKPERRKDTVKSLILYTDTSHNKISEPKCIYVLSVRELHNNEEGVIDPYFSSGFKYREYWQHLYFITEDKKKLPSSWVVWESVSK